MTGNEDQFIHETLPRMAAELSSVAASQRRQVAFAITKEYVVDHDLPQSPTAMLGLIYQACSPVDYQIWFDGRCGSYTVATYAFEVANA